MIKINKIATCTGHSASIYALSEGHDSRHFCSAGGEGWVVEWDLDAPETGRVIATVEGQIFSMCNLSDKNRLIVGNMNGGVHWINRTDPNRTQSVLHHRKGVYDIKTHQGWAFTAGGDGVLTRWSLDTEKPIESLQLSNKALRSITICEKNKKITVGSSDNAIYSLDLTTFAIHKIMQGVHNSSVFTTAYTPDGRYLLSGGRDAMLMAFDVANDFALISAQAAHLFTINHIAFSTDGTLFATASRDKTIKIWDAQHFKLLKVIDVIRLDGHINSVNRLLWYGNTLISCSDDRTIKIWEILREKNES